MRYCYCNVRISTPRPSTCNGCLVAHDQIVGCGQGLLPCGGETTINLNTLNGNPSTAVYALVPNGYSTADFSAVSITAGGVVTLTTANAYTPHGLHNIEYSVTKDGLKNFGTLQVCFDSPCDTGCIACNTCEGTCYGSPDPGTVTVDCMSIGNVYNAGALLNLASCDGTTTWTVTAPAAVSAVVSSLGVITYDMTSDGVPDGVYRITWKAVCSLYGMETTSYLDVTVDNKCTNQICDEGYNCNPCTGDCEEIESDLSTSGGTVVGAGGSAGLIIG